MDQDFIEIISGQGRCRFNVFYGKRNIRITFVWSYPCLGLYKYARKSKTLKNNTHAKVAIGELHLF